MLEVELEEEKKEIVNNYRKLLRKAKTVMKEGDSKIVRKAFNVSLEAHQGVRRKSGEPYIFHPLAVAIICVDEIGLGTTSIIAALLHDVVEDTEISLEDISHMFGEKVAMIIDGLTKINGVFDKDTSQQAENFRKMILTLSDDVRVILIKLADRLHNMRTLNSMSTDKQLKIASETSYIYAPLAHRLGLYAIKTELEDLCLKHTDREVYRMITKKINSTRVNRNKFIRNFIKPIRTEIDRLGFEYEIIGRPKSVHSIWQKMQKQNVPFEEVYDLFAIRIIIDTPIDFEKSICWQIYSMITDSYQPNPDRLRDWISLPKANGYESLHTTVMSEIGQWVEVQIRTKRMDDIAERGYAAHWKYKEINVKGKSEIGLEKWLLGLREVLEQNNGSAIEFVDNFKSNLYSDEVFTFTPKGDLITLPKGATALDFAFHIHTQIGATCIGAKANQKLVPLNYQLRNGDQMEILTSSRQKPNEDWLKNVVTSRAKSKIKETFKEDFKKVVEEGKIIVKRKLKQMKLSFDQENLEKLAGFFQLNTTTELYYNVGIGKIDHVEIKKFKIQKRDFAQRLLRRIISPKSEKQTIKAPEERKIDQLLIGEDLSKLDYTLSKCCNPIAGDNVFAFVSLSEGIKIHRTNCTNAPELITNHGYRILKARWTTSREESFLVGLKLIGTDRIGIISDLSNLISSELKVNMRSLSINTNNGIFEGLIELYVDHTIHLDELMSKVGKISGVVKLSRYN
jgi:GTP diphosphokinase / guanosine-3',5'-bis(diphosphate) 3'-diphosphatase